MHRRPPAFRLSAAVLLGIFLAPTLPVVLPPAVAAEEAPAQVITRGDFIRKAVQDLKIPLTKQVVELPYKRVPASMLPYVKTAYKQGALEHFGAELNLARGISRGDALLFLTSLLGYKPQGTLLKFSDVREGTPEAGAVQVAIEQGWMEGINSTVFGVRRMLSSTEADVLLRKVGGQGGRPGDDGMLPTVTIRYKKKGAVPIPKEDMLRTVWQLLNDQYVRQEKLDPDEAAYRAIESMVESVGDPYTTFMRPLPAAEFQTQIQGEISGIGAQVEYRDDSLIIVAPMPRSPAEKAGLKAGDLIIAVDGVSLKGMNLLEAVSKVRGKKGSTAKLTIRRDGTEFEVTVTRDTIKVPEIDVSKQGDIAVVKLYQFGQRTERELRDMLFEVQETNPRGLILDLRNNPGGLLHAAEIVLSNFVPENTVIARIQTRSENYVEATDMPPTIDSSVPMIVLVNKGSASASEIVAGALQDLKRATVMGSQTFGKGTVQQVIEFNDGSSLKMTIADWHTPNDRTIEGKGITPDVMIEDTDDRDQPMLKALERLR